MAQMDAWNIALLAAAAYVSVVALVRLMRGRRDELTTQMRQQLDREKRRLKAEARKAKQQAAKNAKKAA